KARVLAVCNTNGSQIPRESDAVLYTHAGPEIGVASTKAYLAQITANYLVGLALAQARGTKFPDEVAAEFRQLEQMPPLTQEVVDALDPVRQIARELAGSKSVLFLGRHVGYPTALEGALKLKELAYMHAEGFPAGELKHGPIALIEDGLPVFVVMPPIEGRGVLHSKLVSNIQEIKARGARTIVIAEEGDEVVRPLSDYFIPVPASTTLLQPLLATIPYQAFAAVVAAARGYDVDKPRNLAKSVTVELGTWSETGDDDDEARTPRRGGPRRGASAHRSGAGGRGPGRGDAPCRGRGRAPHGRARARAGRRAVRPVRVAGRGAGGQRRRRPLRGCGAARARVPGGRGAARLLAGARAGAGGAASRGRPDRDRTGRRGRGAAGRRRGRGGRTGWLRRTPRTRGRARGRPDRGGGAVGGGRPAQRRRRRHGHRTP